MCETLVSPHVLWPLLPAVSLGDTVNCADDLSYYIYRCHTFIYGSTLIQVSQLLARPLALFLHSPALPSSFQLAPFPSPPHLSSYLTLLAFPPRLIPFLLVLYRPHFPSVLVIFLTFPLTISTPDIIDSLPTPLSHRHRQGGYIKVTDLPSN